jgi:hypothetical protein
VFLLGFAFSNQPPDINRVFESEKPFLEKIIQRSEGMAIKIEIFEAFLELSPAVREQQSAIGNRLEKKFLALACDGH